MKGRAVPEAAIALSQMGRPVASDGSAEEFVLDGELGRTLRALVDDLKLARVFAERGIDAPTRALFVGPSGVGKTMAAHWIGKQLFRPVHVVRIDAVTDSHLGETAKALREKFEQAERADAVLVLDEVDAISFDRASSGGRDGANQESTRITASLFQQLDALPPDRIVIATTNMVDKLDPALRRRFSVEVVFTDPGPATRGEMARLWLAKAGLCREFAEQLVAKSDGMSGAQFRTLVMTEARAEVRRLL